MTFLDQSLRLARQIQTNPKPLLTLTLQRKGYSSRLSSCLNTPVRRTSALTTGMPASIGFLQTLLSSSQEITKTPFSLLLGILVKNLTKTKTITILKWYIFTTYFKQTSPLQLDHSKENIERYYH